MVSMSRLLSPWRHSIVMTLDDFADPPHGFGKQRRVVVSGRRLRALCERETLAEATAAATALVVGVPVHHTPVGGPYRPYSHVVSFSLDDTCCTAAAVFTSTHEAWSRLSPSREPRRRSKRLSRAAIDHRVSMLAQMLTQFKVDTPIEELVRLPYAATGSRTVDIGAALPLWWDARLAEGCAPEAARVLLALSVDIETMRHVEFTETGHPVLTA